MQSSRAKRLCLALIPAALAVVAITGTAAAAGPKAITKTTTVSTAFGLPPQAQGNGVGLSVLNCPEGTTVTDGGGLFTPGTPSNTAIALFESFPAGIGWSVRFDNDTAVPQTVTNNVICIKNKLKVKGGAKSASASGAAQGAKSNKPRALVGLVQQVTQPVEVPPQAVNNGIAEFTVNCPTGTLVVGGGPLFPAATPLTTNTELFESGPVGNGWHVRWNNNQAVAQAASLTALCMAGKLKVKGNTSGLKKPKAKTAIQQLQQSLEVPPQATNAGVVEANLNCPSGTTVVGGGARFDPSVALQTGIELFESGPQGNGWHARFNNDTTTIQPAAILVRCIKDKLGVG